MAHCERCKKFMMISSANGYCKDCTVIIKQEKERTRRQEEENKKKLEAEEAERRRLKEEEERKIREERKNIADNLFNEAKSCIDLEYYEAALSNLQLIESNYSEFYPDNIVRSMLQEIECKRTEKRYLEAVKNLEEAVDVDQVERSKAIFSSLGSFRDSEEKYLECIKKELSIEQANEEKRRKEEEIKEREERKRREEEEKERKRLLEEEIRRKIEMEKIISMNKFSLRSPFIYYVCCDLRNRGILSIKDKGLGKNRCIIKEISLSDEYLKHYFGERFSQKQDKMSLRYQYANASVIYDPFCISLAETQWLEISLGRVMINQIERHDKKKFYSCIIFFDELELVFEYYPEEFAPEKDLQSINDVFSTLRYGQYKEQDSSKKESKVEATKKAEAWMVRPENRGTLLFFSMWLSNHGSQSLKEQMIIKFRENNVLTEDEIEVVDYSYLIRSFD